MGNVLTNLLAFIAAISILVAIHEYGHYIVGRWMGMKVLRFSIGFGKPLFSRVGGKDGTEYCVSAIPLGGYVKFLDTRDCEVAAADEGRAFDQRPIPARIAVLFAGPLFNFLFAIIAFWFLTMDGVPAARPTIGVVTPDSYAAEAGLVEGEQIVAVGDQAVGSWDATLIALLDSLVSDKRIPLTVENVDGDRLTKVIELSATSAAALTEPGFLFEGLGFAAGKYPVVIDSPEAGAAAEKAGLLEGDRIVAVDGKRIEQFADLVAIVQPRPGERIAVDFVRDQRRMTVTATLGELEVNGEKLGLLGVRSQIEKIGVVPSLVVAVEQTWAKSVFTVQMFARMLTGDVSIKNISGPINIAQFAGDSAQRGLPFFVDFLIVVSISLGVLNLLPIPVLDGGQIVYQMIEWIKGSPMTEQAQIMGQQVGIFALLLLMSFAFYNDIARILE